MLRAPTYMLFSACYMRNIFHRFFFIVFFMGAFCKITIDILLIKNSMKVYMAQSIVNSTNVTVWSMHAPHLLIALRLIVVERFSACIYNVIYQNSKPTYPLYHDICMNDSVTSFSCTYFYVLVSILTMII